MPVLQTYPAPEAVFRYFYAISRIPRPSGREDAIASYLVDFARARHLAWHRDSANNVIIIKEASSDRETDEPIILQGHMDMVCEKESWCTKDMDTEGLDLRLDGDWLSAEGTTLGGDDGIAVAIALALLDDDTLSHPRLEFVCTTEEETGMGGAQAFDPAPLQGHLLLNIDSEAEGVLTVGCAGGVTVRLHIPFTGSPTDAGTATAAPLCLVLRGLTGGHSGTAIQHGRANADVLMIRILRELSQQFAIRLVSLSGGNKNNAIPREARAVIWASAPEAVAQHLSGLAQTLQTEYAVTDPGLQLIGEPCTPDNPASTSALSVSDTRALLSLLSSLPDGVQRMDPQLPNLVETSLNLGILQTTGQELYAEYLLRSSSNSRLAELRDRMLFLAEQAGVPASCADPYPAWPYVPRSSFRDTMVRLFREQYGREPIVETIHAGLECGLLAGKIPGLDAVSIGPDIPDIHTPQEKLSVSSVARTYAYIRRILEEH